MDGDAIQVRRLVVADLPDVLALQGAVLAELPAGFVRAKAEAELWSYLDGSRGVAYGVRGGARLLATSLLRVPLSAHPNAGAPFPLVPASEWPCHAAFLENAMVLPAARGRGYQRALFEMRRVHAASVGMRWLCGGVWLDNRASWTNLLRSGMVIAGIRFDRGGPVIGCLRSCDGTLPSVTPEERLVDVHDAARHDAALRDGWVGVGPVRAGRVVYRRLRDAAGRAA